MKKLLYIVLTTIFLGCEKAPIKLVYGPSNNISDQKVLIEEFTGVQCTFCPQGSDEIESLVSLHSGNVIAISIHSGFFAKPTPKNKYDFRTPDGDDLYNILGAGAFYPAASINRIRFDANLLINNQATWAGNIQQLISKPSKAGLSIENDYNKITRELNIKLTGIAKEDFAEKLLIHVMIAESNIEDFQKDFRIKPSGEVLDYVHKHVFRDAITPVSGDEFAQSAFKGQSFSKNYSITLPDSWVAENCNVIAFISYSTKLDIIQVNELKVVQ